MATREGMANLIAKVRGMCDAGVDDYVVAGVTYWTDAQIEEALDDRRDDIRRELLQSRPELIAASTTVYHDYYWQEANVEEAASGTTAFLVHDSTGSAVAGTAYEVNYRARHLRFTADTRGTAYYLSYRSFDLERTAADVWDVKAGHAHSRFDLRTDNHDMKRSQIFDRCVERAQHYRRQAKARTSRLVRSDANPVRL